jgi:hypothetical protein
MVCALTPPTIATGGEQAGDLKAMQGTWTIKAMEKGGEATATAQGTLKGNGLLRPIEGDAGIISGQFTRWQGVHTKFHRENRFLQKAQGNRLHTVG